jgi:glucan phosphoethanolaminetransferase (alkaline phosphatase superfamily)
MKQPDLFPPVFKRIGWIIFPRFRSMGVAFLFSEYSFFELECKVLAIINDDSYFEVMQDDIYEEIMIVGLIVSMIFIVFSKEKDEDEYIAQIRMYSLVWSILIGSALLLLATVFVYGLYYMTVAFLNMFLILFLFVIKFNIELYKFRRTGRDQ